MTLSRCIGGQTFVLIFCLLEKVKEMFPSLYALRILQYFRTRQKTCIEEKEEPLYEVVCHNRISTDSFESMVLYRAGIVILEILKVEFN